MNKDVLKTMSVHCDRESSVFYVKSQFGNDPQDGPHASAKQFNQYSL